MSISNAYEKCPLPRIAQRLYDLELPLWVAGVLLFVIGDSLVTGYGYHLLATGQMQTIVEGSAVSAFILEMFSTDVTNLFYGYGIDYPHLWGSALPILVCKSVVVTVVFAGTREIDFASTYAACLMIALGLVAVVGNSFVIFF